MKIIEKLKKNEKLWRLLMIAKDRFSEAELGNSSVVVAYYLLLSLFPLLIAVGNLLPFLHIDPQSVLPYMQELIPENIYSFLGPAIEDLLTNGSGGLLSISAVATLWSASQSINALQSAMNKAYGVDDRQNIVVVRIVSLLVIVLFMVALIGVSVVIGLGQAVLDFLQPMFQISDNLIGTFQTLKWPLTILALLVIMSLIFWLVPNAKVTLRSTLPGTVFTTIGWLLLGQLFGIYAQFFASKISGYQIIGSFIVLMIWLNFMATIIIIGGILNAVVAEYTTGAEVQEREGPVSKLSAKIEEKFSKDKEN